MAKTKKTVSIGKDMEKMDLTYTAEREMTQSLWKTVPQFIKKIKHRVIT